MKQWAKQHRHRRRSLFLPGFTIVELLIVIVVIAILATITIVSYNGITNQAKSSELAVTVRNVDEALRMNISEYGEVVTSLSGEYTSCLGMADDYPETDDFPEGACAPDGDGAYYMFNQTVNDAFIARLNSPVDVDASQVVEAWGDKYRGMWVWIEDENYEVEMVLPGSIQCPSNMRQYNTSEGNHWCERNQAD